MKIKISKWNQNMNKIIVIIIFIFCITIFTYISYHYLENNYQNNYYSSYNLLFIHYDITEIKRFPYVYMNWIIIIYYSMILNQLSFQIEIHSIIKILFLIVIKIWFNIESTIIHIWNIWIIIVKNIVLRIFILVIEWNIYE
jgi:hypothetical protein